MKFRPARLGSAQSLVALSVSLAVVLSSHTFAFASPAKSGGKSTAAKTVASQKQTDSPESELRLISATATATAAGVLLQWRTNSATDNVGFNVYRLRDGQRTRVNKEIIPGAVFAPGPLAQLRGGYSYSWLDRGGTADATYYIESVSLQGTAKTHEPLSPVTSKTASGFEQTADASSGANATEGTGSAEKYYPAAEAQLNSPQGAVEDQWAIAAQTALKIAIKKDGWYRVTQPQMVAAGFDPTVDIGNLRLFVDAQEVAINTSQHSGPFGSGDYIEFYGSGLDKPTTDTRIYYLIAGTTPGKRVRGEIQLDEDPILPPAPTSTPPPPSPGGSPPGPPASPDSPKASPGPLLQDPIFFSWAQRDLLVLMESLRPGSAPVMGATAQEQTAGADGERRSPRGALEGRNRDDSVAANNTAPEANVPVADTGADRAASANNPVASTTPRGLPAQGPRFAPGADKNNPVATTPAGRGAPRYAAGAGKMRGAGKFRKGSVSKKRKRKKLRRQFKQERNHAVVSTASASAASVPPNFANTAERKDRGVYFVTVLNGDSENYFGQVIAFNATNPASQTINTPNPDLTAAGTAQLEIALQGVNQVLHQISVEFNGVVLSPPFSFFGFDPLTGGHPVQVFNIPISQLHDGANTIRFILPAGGDVSIVDYTKLTYPHLFRYEKATGNIHLVNQPNDGDTLVVGGKTYTFKTSPTTNLHIGIGVDKPTTATNIAARINIDTATTLCTAVSGPADVGLTANTGGTAGNSITLNVDGLRLTQTLVADPGALKFTLRGTQSVTVDGFSTSSVRLIDYTDPLNVGISRPASAPSGPGFAITVPTSDPPSKPSRLLYAIADGQFDQPAALTLSQPSTLNQGILSPTVPSGADFLIVSHKNFIPSLAPLLSQRQSQQAMTAAAVDIEDVYDEFSYGVHGPQAIRDFLQYASTHWVKKPRYVIFAGDATYDPRNYENQGNFDFVPTKLVDATFNETASDDWLADFDNDGVADIPVGRLPVRTTADATLVVSKIVNFSPVNVPQSALLVADQDDQFHSFQFVEANDAIQSQLPASMTVQRINRGTPGTPPDFQIKLDIIAGLNEGRAVVGYSGHGNVNVWTGASIFTASDAVALTNGNKLSFVVVMDCLNGYFIAPNLDGIAEALVKAPGGGAVAAFASSGLTIAQGQHVMSQELYHQLYGSPQSPPLGDAIKIAKAATFDIDVKRTWIFFGDPSVKIR